MKCFLLRCFKKNEFGVALVEFALVAPILILLVLGIVEFGWVFNGFVSLNGAAREGARYATRMHDFEEANIQAELDKQNHATLFLETFQVVNVDIVQEHGNPNSAKYNFGATVTLDGEVKPPVTFFRELLYPGSGGIWPLTAEATMRAR